MRVRRLALAAAIVGLGALSFSSSAQACSCARISPEAALRQADAAIVGRLVEVAQRDRFNADYRYLVRRSYKHSAGIRAGETVMIRSGPSGAACGFPDDEEHWYGMFLNRSYGQWSGGLCGLVQPQRLKAAAARVRREGGSDEFAGLSCAS